MTCDSRPTAQGATTDAFVSVVEFPSVEEAGG
jgi:hypothetical protein